MNINDHFCLSQHLPAIALYQIQQNRKCLHILHIFVVANIQGFKSQIFGVVGPLAENLDFLVRWDLTFKQILITKPQNPALLSESYETLSE